MAWEWEISLRSVVLLEPIEWGLLPLYRECQMPLKWLWNEEFQYADVAQLVERKLPKLEVAGSRPVVRLVA